MARNGKIGINRMDRQFLNSFFKKIAHPIIYCGSSVILFGGCVAESHLPICRTIVERPPFQQNVFQVKGHVFELSTEDLLRMKSVLAASCMAQDERDGVEGILRDVADGRRVAYCIENSLQRMYVFVCRYPSWRDGVEMWEWAFVSTVLVRGGEEVLDSICFNDSVSIGYLDGIGEIE